VKECHPDCNRERQAWADRQVRLILEAYRTLADAQKRLAYDQIFRNGSARPEPVRAQRRRPATLYDLAEMVLFDLMAGNGAAAVQNYEALCRDHAGFSLLNHLPVNDYLDCSFLLGEEYERQGRFERALEFYVEVYNEERSEPRRRYFHDEVRDRIRNIYARELARSSPPDVALGYYRRLLDMDLGRGETAFFYKKMAECYFRMGDMDSARSTLGHAFTLKPGLKGAQKICLKLGVIPPVPAPAPCRPHNGSKAT
jgi:tetratricopeptide (TPR) repeat protein